MPLLLNNSTKKVENIADADVTQAIATGAYSPRQGSRLVVMSPTGDKESIDANEAQMAFTMGYNYLSREQEKQIADAKIKSAWRESFDAPVTAAAAGALRGLTFGLSDVGFSAVGGEDFTKGLATLKEVNPKASIAGELGGVAVGAVGGNILGAGIKGASRLGALAGEQTIGRLATKYGADSVVTRIAQTALGGAVEGSLYGAGSVISEAALDDPKLSVQSALSTIGTGAILGGAFGGLTKAGGEAYGAFKDLLQKSTVPTAAADTLGKLYSKVTSLTRGMAPDDAAEMERLIGTREGRDLVFNATQDRSVNEKTMVNALADMRKVSDALKSIWGDTRETARAELGMQKIGGIRNTLNKDLNSTIDSAINTISKQPEFYVQNVIPALNRIKSNLNQGFSSIQDKAELHELLQINRELLDSKMKFSAFERSGDTAKTEKLLGDVRDKFVGIMTDPKYFGDYANQYRELNAAYNAIKTTETNFLKQFGTKGLDDTGMSNVWQIDPQKVATFYRNPETLKSANKVLGLDKFQDAIEKIEAAARATKPKSKALVTPGETIEAGIPGTPAPEISELLLQESQSARGIFNRIKDARTSELFLNNLETRTGKTMIGTMIGAMIGTPGGIPGQILGAAAGAAFATPRSFLNILLNIENHGIAGQQRVQGAVGNFLGNKIVKKTIPAASKIEPLAKPITIKGAIDILGGDSETKQDIPALKKKIDEHVQDPQKIWLILNDNNPAMEDVAPVYTQEMVNTINTGLQFLQSKMPQQYNQELFGNNHFPITDKQERDLSAYTDAVFRPGKIFDDLEKGKVDPRTVEAIQAVYPELYSNLRKEVMMQSVDSKVDYHKKLALGKLFALPTTASLANIDKMQALYTQQTPQLKPKAVNFKTIKEQQTVADSLQI